MHDNTMIAFHCQYGAQRVKLVSLDDFKDVGCIYDGLLAADSN